MSPSDLRDQLQRTLGEQYVVERELARGGMSRVYLAQDRTLGREVVVKALSPELAADVNFERFAREIRMAGRLQHPHIVPLLMAGDAEGTPFFVMPYVAGESLRERLTKSGELPVDEAIRMLRDVATALDYAHKQGIIHRDIKPENILLTGGTAVVTDFGVAKAVSDSAHSEGSGGNLTTAGVALGTPTYMAPEQASADPSTDQRADIYAWGMVAYELLTGAAPFTGRSTQAIIAAHISEPVPAIHRAGVPPRLALLILKTLSKRPADRPQSAQELISELDALTATVITPSESIAGSRRSRTLVRLAGGLGALILLAGGFVFLRTRGASRVSGVGSAMKRIAVLPFANASGSKDEEYFADGMSEELGAALGRVRGVQVASHNSAFSFKGKNVDVKEVGRKLDVDAVLEGKVRRAGNRLRVTAELTDVNNGLSLWSDSYERDANDVFAVQNDIARAIARALEVKFSERTSAVASGEIQGTKDPQAYDLYLRARYYWHKRGADNLRRAVELFQAAIARDPNFARAFAGAASSYELLTEYSDKAPADAEARARSAADRALSLDSTVAEAYLARGLGAVHLWKWDEAAQSYRRALELDPNNSTAHQWYGELFYTLGEADSSIAHMRRAKALDPLAPIAAVALSYALYAGRHYKEALPEAFRARELAPDLGLVNRVIALVFLQLGDSARALAAAQANARAEPEASRALGVLAYVAGSVGHLDEARTALRALETNRGSPLAVSMAYLGLGERERAIAALQRTVALHDAALSQYAFMLDPAFDSLRENDRFKQIVAATGLGRAP